MTYYDLNGNKIEQPAGAAVPQNGAAQIQQPTVQQNAQQPTVQPTGSGSTSADGSVSFVNNGPANAAPNSTNKYANVGDMQTYNPNYGMDYHPSAVGQAYNAAMQRIAQGLGSKPTYNNKYDVQLESAYNAIVNRDPFSWDASSDPFYKQYEKRYTQLGQQAMRDTMGQAAALTGGYGNSYGQYVGQSAYNQYMDALADKSVELEERAYNRYQDAGAEMYRQYQLLTVLRDTEYNQYRDQVGDWNYNLALLQAQEAEDYERAQYLNGLRIESEQMGYNRWRDAMSDARYEDELGYSRWRDTISDQRYDQEFAYQQQRDAVKDSQWQQEFDFSQQKYADSLASKGSGGGSGSGGSASGTGTPYTSQYGSTITTGTNGRNYSLNGYTGTQIQTTLAEQAAQQYLEDTFLNDGIVRIRK